MLTPLQALMDVNRAATEVCLSCPLQVIDDVSGSLWAGLWKHGDLSAVCAQLHGKFHIQIVESKNCIMFRESVLKHFSHVLRITPL